MNQKIMGWVISAFFMLAMTGLHSQDEKRIKCQFRAFSWGKKVTDICYAPEEGKEMKLSLSMQKLTDMLKYDGLLNAGFYKKEMIDGEMQKVPVSTFQFIEGSPLQLIIVFANNQELPYRTLVYDNKFNDFKLGQLRLYNFTQKNIAMRLDEEIHGVTPLKTKVMAFPEGKDKTNVEFSKLYDGGGAFETSNMAIGVNGEDGWQATFRSSWPRKPYARTHFFVFPLGKKQYRVHYLYEFPPQKKVKATEE